LRPMRSERYPESGTITNEQQIARAVQHRRPVGEDKGGEDVERRLLRHSRRWGNAVRVGRSARQVRPDPSPAAPHPPAPLGARVRAPVGWRISDAPGVPPSPRSREEGWGEGALLYTALSNSPPTPIPSIKRSTVRMKAPDADLDVARHKAHGKGFAKSRSNSDRSSGIHHDAFARFRKTISLARSTKARKPAAMWRRPG